MTDDEFKKEMLGEFSASERTDLPWQLAKEYYARCDAYDATVCTGTGRDGPMPASNWEHRAINLHAIQVMRELKQKALQAGFTNDDLLNAMRDYIKAGK